MISSSKLELVDRCPGAFTLPWIEESTAHSEAGNARHAEDETAINAGDVPEVYDERWPGLSWRAEVSYAYDVATGLAREIGVGLRRAYGDLGPFEVPGTIDAEGRGDGVLVVVDRKGFEAQLPADHHPQVRFLALAAARAKPADHIEVAIRPEIGPIDVAVVDPVFDLDVIAYDVKRRVIDTASLRSAARSGLEVPFHAGRWCRWCPAFNACPQQRELRDLVVQDDDHPELATQIFVDDQSAADVYALWKRIGILHKRIGQQLYAHAANQPIPLTNGKVFGRRETMGDREYDGAKVHEVISQIEGLGRDVADRVVTMSLTQARFDEVIKPLVPRGKLASTKRAVFGEVERRGGMTRKTTTTIDEHLPQKVLEDRPNHLKVVTDDIE